MNRILVALFLILGSSSCRAPVPAQAPVPASQAPATVSEAVPAAAPASAAEPAPVSAAVPATADSAPAVVSGEPIVEPAVK